MGSHGTFQQHEFQDRCCREMSSCELLLLPQAVYTRCCSNQTEGTAYLLYLLRDFCWIMHSCSQHVYNESILALFWVSRVTLSRMYMSGRVESSSQCISTWSYTYKAQTRRCYLLGDVHAGSMLGQLTYNHHIPLPIRAVSWSCTGFNNKDNALLRSHSQQAHHNACRQLLQLAVHQTYIYVWQSSITSVCLGPQGQWS